VRDEWPPRFFSGHDRELHRCRSSYSGITPLRPRLAARRLRTGRRPCTGYSRTRAFELAPAQVKGDPRGWLYTILYHRFLTDRGRRNRRSAFERPTAIVERELSGVEGGQDSALEYRDLLRAFAILPEEQRSVLLLIGVEDLSYEEAARVLGVPIGTVMSRLSRGRERLRRLTGYKPAEKVRQTADDLSSVA